MAKRVPTKTTKISDLQLEYDYTELTSSGMNDTEVAEILSAQTGEKITKYDIAKHKTYTASLTKQERAQGAKMRAIKAMDQQFDIIREIGDLYGRTKNLMDAMEDTAYNTGENISPYEFKAVSSEMRSNLMLMIDIQKEMSSYNGIRHFLEIIFEVLKEEAPESIPKILEKVKTSKDAQWFQEILKGGI